MKFFAFVAGLFFVASALVHAQTNADTPAKPTTGSAEVLALSILTPDQQLEYAKAHEKALEDDPTLKAENDALKEQYVSVMTSGTPAEKQAIMEKVDSHRQKLRKAMLKEDPNLGPIFAQIDKSISQMKAKAGKPSQ